MGTPLAALLLLLIHRSGGTSVEEVFSSAPQKEPYYVTEGGSGPTLSCSVRAPFSDRSQYEILWSRYHNGQIRHISRNEKLHEKEHFELNSDASSGAYDLRIKMVSRAHVEGSYQCTVLDPNSGEQFSTDTANVITLVPPEKPVVAEAPTEPVTEGDTVTIKCTSTGGSPDPTFSWHFPNGSTAHEKLFNTATKNGITESILHFRVVSDDNGAFVTCAVTNKAIDNGPSKEEHSPRLNVLFKPRVHVLPVQDLTVEAGQPVELVCETESNPSPPSYEWKHLPTGDRYVAAKWPLIADKKMAGEFECRARNSVGEGADVINLNVQYTPEVSVKERVNPSEGERVEVECFVTANPKAAEIRWAGPDGFLSEGPILILKSVTREQSGNYTCSATNYLTIYGQTGSQTRTGAAVTFVDVKRRPGKGVITTTKRDVLVGDQIELECTAPDPGSPEAQFKWASPSSGGLFGTKDHDRSVLIIPNAQLADNGRYRCRPHNRLGEGEEAAVDVTVIEPAKISRPLTTERIYNSGESAGGLECEAQGYPAPHIRWLKDGLPVEGKRYKMETTIVKSSCSEKNFCSQTVTGTLVFTQPIQWADKGNYTCFTFNGAAERAPLSESWSVVRVVHGPVILNEKYPTDSLAATELGATSVLRCVVSSRPRPNFTWMFNSATIEETGRYSFETNNLYDRPDEYEHVLMIEKATHEDLGGYLCRATNGMGDKAEVVIQLKESSVPQPPSSLQKISSTPVSLLIGWRPGFDGGSDQSYVLEYTAMNTLALHGSDEVATLDIRNATRVMEIKGDGTPMYMMTYNLTSLKPLTTYYFRVRAANRKGFSDFSPNTVATTNDVFEDTNMIAPSHIGFDVTSKIIEIEPKTPKDGCVMLYVSSGETYRATQCFPADQVVNELPKEARSYRVRFCSRSNSLRCSAMSPVLEAVPMTAGYTYYMLIPIISLVALVVVVLLVAIICCRTRGPKKDIKRSPAAIAAMPEIEAKNTIVHGSNADSGVFTLDSGRVKSGNQGHTYSSSSEETAAETWSPEQYDVHQDPYLNDPTLHIFQGGDHVEERSLSEHDEEDGRRVMREIIV